MKLCAVSFDESHFKSVSKHQFGPGQITITREGGRRRTAEECLCTWVKNNRRGRALRSFGARPGRRFFPDLESMQSHSARIGGSICRKSFATKDLKAFELSSEGPTPLPRYNDLVFVAARETVLHRNSRD